jgi:hypothetical protein
MSSWRACLLQGEQALAQTAPSLGAIEVDLGGPVCRTTVLSGGYSNRTHG